MAAFTLKAKLLIQSMWCKTLEWDEEIPVEFQSVWKRWLQGISEIKRFEIKSCYHRQGWKCSKIQLHVFGDASEAAYGELVIRDLNSKTDQFVTVLSWPN